MKDVVLLSEIHPLATNLFNPLDQAHNWFSLLTPEDIQWMNRKGQLNLLEAIDIVYQRCEERGKTLIIRDWSHLDFTAIPFLPRPSYRLTLADVLKERFCVVHAATVRHPIDQWLSLRRLPLLENKITLEFFLRGYRRFAEHCARIGFIRYEDLTQDNVARMCDLCDKLKIRFDPEFNNRWASYDKITGDKGGGRGGSVIRPLPRRTTEPGLIEQFEKNADYLHTIELLGYRHPL
jgi:hypothetical protein